MRNAATAGAETKGQFIGMLFEFSGIKPELCVLLYQRVVFACIIKLVDCREYKGKFCT